MPQRRIKLKPVTGRKAKGTIQEIPERIKAARDEVVALRVQLRKKPSQRGGPVYRPLDRYWPRF